MPSVRRQPRLVHTISDEGPPTLKRIEAGRPVSRADRNNEDSVPNTVPVGWRGKKTSKDKYTEFGAKNGLGKSYDFGIGGGGKDGKDSDRNRKTKGRENDNGSGGGGEDNPRGNDPEDIVASISNLELDQLDDEDLADFKDRPLRMAKSLFSHSYEDEMRKRMKVAQEIEAEFRQNQDEHNRDIRLAEEKRRQEHWTLDQAREGAFEKAKVLRNPLSINIPVYSSNDRLPPRFLNQWVWKKIILHKIETLGKEGPKEPPNSSPVDGYYQKCYLWMAPNGQQGYFPESQVVNRDIVQLRICPLSKYFEGDSIGEEEIVGDGKITGNNLCMETTPRLWKGVAKRAQLLNNPKYQLVTSPKKVDARTPESWVVTPSVKLALGGELYSSDQTGYWKYGETDEGEVFIWGS